MIPSTASLGELPGFGGADETGAQYGQRDCQQAHEPEGEQTKLH